MGNLKTYKTGLWAEWRAAWGLRLRGYRIVATRFKTPVGEIDLIARRGRIVAFIEVKGRAEFDAALEAVSPQNAQRVRRAAEWWLKTHGHIADKCDIRFDVVAVAPYARIRHISNAF